MYLPINNVVRTIYDLIYVFNERHEGRHIEVDGIRDKLL
jgi:hypothetical protein